MQLRPHQPAGGANVTVEKAGLDLQHSLRAGSFCFLGAVFINLVFKTDLS